MYSEPSQTSKFVRFPKLVSGWKPFDWVLKKLQDNMLDTKIIMFSRRFTSLHVFLWESIYLLRITHLWKYVILRELGHFLLFWCFLQLTQMPWHVNLFDSSVIVCFQRKRYYKILKSSINHYPVSGKVTLLTEPSKWIKL